MQINKLLTLKIYELMWQAQSDLSLNMLFMPAEDKQG